MTRSPRTSRPRRGFTLIEMMATVVVLSTLGSIATFMVVDAVDGYQKAVTAAQLHAELAVALDRVAREFRRIPPDLTDGGTTVYTFIANSQVLWTDANGDDAGVWVSGANNLQLDPGANPTQTLIPGVSSFAFAAFDEDNNDLGGFFFDEPRLRRLQLDVTVTRDGVSQSLRAKAFIRATMEGGG